MKIEEILSVPFHQLGFSTGFCKSCEIMGFKTLNEIIFIQPHQLIKKNGFTYIWLGELVSYLDSKKALYLLQPFPGKSHD